ncbi:MAG: hypothetical protein FE78DRAFT_94310 [Acidomyces sp. 'richmondensis']|nr:MAG: hypothetical protein FE78DRAFT_94310 [Acidomyces sp. 'richmondensis']
MAQCPSSRGCFRCQNGFPDLGDLIDKWTNGSYKNTLHRVINVSGKDRYSVPCFYQGDFTYKYPFNPRDEDEETVEMHIRRKFDQSYGI